MYILLHILLYLIVYFYFAYVNFSAHRIGIYNIILIIRRRRIFIPTRSIPRKNTTYNSNDNKSIYTYYKA